MLTLTRKTDYALIALTHLSHCKGTCVSAREIATLYGLPLPLLMNVLKLLSQQGLAKSIRGPRGGYELAEDAESITLYDIIQAVEGPIQLVQCIDHGHSLESGDQADTPSASNDSPDDVKMDDAVRASRSDDSSERDNDAVDGSPKKSGCDLVCTCPVRLPIRRIQDKLVDFVREVTLADVAEGCTVSAGESSNDTSESTISLDRAVSGKLSVSEKGERCSASLT